MSYLFLKNSHYSLALISLGGFMLRGLWMWSGSPLLEHRLTRVLPHIVDTLFLLAGILLAVRIAQYPIAQGWLTAKVVGLVVYIVLGMIALRRGKTRQVRLLAFFAAIAVFAWIISVASSKSPWGFLAGVVG